MTAGGGNVDTDAIDADENWFYDLVFNTTFQVDPNAPEDERLDSYVPSYGWKAGTSFSAPQVTGLVALLRELAPDASAAEIRSVIESTASQEPVGKAGQTTAPESYPDVLGQSEGVNVGIDGELNGDQPSNPGSNPQTLPPADYRGSGHIDVKKAVERLS